MSHVTFAAKIRRRLLTAAALAIACASAGSALAVPVYSPLTNSYYDYINRDIADTGFTTWTWQDAKADAEARSFMGRSGHLVTLTSADEEQVLIDNWFADILYGQPWIGGFRTAGSDPLTGWQWVTGEAFSHTNWRVGEPNDAPPPDSELYIHYQSVNVASTTQWDSWGWNDIPGGSSRSYFIEYSAVPEPAALGLLGLGLLGIGGARRRKT